jgi:type II secretory pathway component PulF
MALYFYQAFSKDGKKTTGYIDAPSVASAKEQLSKNGLFPTSVTPATAEEKLPWWKRLFAGSVSTKDKILFTKQLAILLRSGVPLLQALELLIEQFTGALHSMLVAIKDDVKEGISLAQAMSKYPKTFDNIYVQLVRAGEASGKLEMILERLTILIERQEALRKRVQGAFMYPIIQLVISVLVVAVLLIFVVPKLASNFSSQGQQLPLTTRILVGLSTFLASYYIYIGIVLLALFFVFRYWASTPSGRRKIDELKLRLPFIRFFAKTTAVVQFSQTLGMLLEGGVNLPESLDIVVNIIDNQVLADTLREARDKIIKQGKISQYLKQTNIFPPIAIYLISTGEQTGQLDTMLLTVAKNYEDELNELSDRLATIVGPIMLIGMAFIVGFIVLSIVQPMFQMGNLGGTKI